MISTPKLSLVFMCIGALGVAACSESTTRKPAADNGGTTGSKGGSGGGGTGGTGTGGSGGGMGGSGTGGRDAAMGGAGTGGTGTGGTGTGGTGTGGTGTGGTGTGGNRDGGTGGTGMGGMGGRDAAVVDMQRPVDLAPAPDRMIPSDVNQAMADTTCTSWATERCKKRTMCTPLNLERVYGTEANCITEEKANCLRQVNYPWSGDRIAKLMTCTTATTAQTCANFLAGVIIPDCEISPGGIEPGGICISARQCQGRVCTIAATQLCGACEAPAMTGGACRGSGQCPVGDVCAANVCVKPAAAGAACNNNSKPCDTGLSCVGTANGVDGMCVKFASAENAPCDSERATLPICDVRLGLFCLEAPAASTDAGATDAGPAVGKCALIKFANVGQACGTDPATNARTDCRAGNICQRLIPDGGTVRSPLGTCVADATEGQPCNTSGQIGPNCGVGLACVTTMAGSTAGTCKARVQSACPATLP